MTDPLIRLSSLPATVESLTGERPTRQTIYRWHRVGVAGVRLKAIWASGSLRSRESWLRQFFADVTEAKMSTNVDKTSACQTGQESGPMGPDSYPSCH